MRSTQSAAAVNQAANDARDALEKMAKIEEHGRAEFRKTVSKELGEFTRSLESSRVPDGAIPWLLSDYFKYMIGAIGEPPASR